MYRREAGFSVSTSLKMLFDSKNFTELNKGYVGKAVRP